LYHTRQSPVNESARRRAEKKTGRALRILADLNKPGRSAARQAEFCRAARRAFAAGHAVYEKAFKRKGRWAFVAFAAFLLDFGAHLCYNKI
jgi:hypothetical protein